MSLLKTFSNTCNKIINGLVVPINIRSPSQLGGIKIIPDINKNTEIDMVFDDEIVGRRDAMRSEDRRMMERRHDTLLPDGWTSDEEFEGEPVGRRDAMLPDYVNVNDDDDEDRRHSGNGIFELSEIPHPFYESSGLYSDENIVERPIFPDVPH